MYPIGHLCVIRCTWVGANACRLRSYLNLSGLCGAASELL
jgi:hypothetical protein